MQICHLMASVIFWTFASTAVLGGDDPKKDKDAPKEEEVSDYKKSTTKGALEVKAANDKPLDWFAVYADKQQKPTRGNTRLNSTVELAPGTYVVRVNKTERKFTIEAGKKVTLLTGDLVVEAPKGTPGWFIPYQGKQVMLARNPSTVNNPVALFAGKYEVTYKKGGVSPEEKLGEAEVRPGRKTVVKR
jgi:hypothetical protein